MFDAVVFDLFETLITEFDPQWRYRPSTAERLGVSSQAFAAAWDARTESRITGGYASFREVLTDICITLECEIDDALLDNLLRERLNAKALPFLRVEADIVHMLDELHRCGRRVGLVSNCAPEEIAAWDMSLLAVRVDVAVFSCQVGCAKPDGRIYHLACDRLGVAPERTLFVGDGGSNELTGAARVGLVPVQARWFLDRWPNGVRLTRDHAATAPYPSFHDPSEVVAFTLVQRSNMLRW